jgi:hypothetical protein
MSINTENKGVEQKEHPLLSLTRDYISNYEKLMQDNKDQIEAPMQSLDMISSLVSSIEKFVVSVKHQNHKRVEKDMFPEGYKHLSNSVDTFTKEQLLWILNECQMNGSDIEPEADMTDETKIAEWFKDFLKTKFICRYCKELGHQYGFCSKLNVLPCALCGNEDHFGSECNSSKAKLLKNNNRPLVVRGRGGRGRKYGFNHNRRNQNVQSDSE